MSPPTVRKYTPRPRWYYVLGATLVGVGAALIVTAVLDWGDEFYRNLFGG